MMIVFTPIVATLASILFTTISANPVNPITTPSAAYFARRSLIGNPAPTNCPKLGTLFSACDACRLGIWGIFQNPQTSTRCFTNDRDLPNSIGCPCDFDHGMIHPAMNGYLPAIPGGLDAPSPWNTSLAQVNLSLTWATFVNHHTAQNRIYLSIYSPWPSDPTRPHQGGPLIASYSNTFEWTTSPGQNITIPPTTLPEAFKYQITACSPSSSQATKDQHINITFWYGDDDGNYLSQTVYVDGTVQNTGNGITILPPENTWWSCQPGQC